MKNFFIIICLFLTFLKSQSMAMFSQHAAIGEANGQEPVSSITVSTSHIYIQNLEDKLPSSQDINDQGKYKTLKQKKEERLKAAISGLEKFKDPLYHSHSKCMYISNCSFSGVEFLDQLLRTAKELNHLFSISFVNTSFGGSSIGALINNLECPNCQVYFVGCTTTKENKFLIPQVIPHAIIR